MRILKGTCETKSPSFVNEHKSVTKRPLKNILRGEKLKRPGKISKAL